MKILIVALFCLAPAVQAFDQLHSVWDQWLRTHVSLTGGISTVDYKKAKADRKAFDAYVGTLEGVTPTEFTAFSETQKQAFFINGYNAFTVKLILDNYPVKSIKDLSTGISVFGTSPWKKKFFTLLGEQHYLDWIEHENLRKDYSEPRFHFALVCASKSCPPMRDEAYVASQLDSQLNSQADAFLKEPARNRYEAEKNRLVISKIFDWYGADFVKKSGSVQNFIAPRLAKDVAEEARIKSATLEFQEYNWTLNEAESTRGVTGD